MEDAGGGGVTPEGSKAGRNKRRDLFATFLNNLAVAFVLAAVLQPVLAVIQQQRSTTVVEVAASAIFLGIAAALLVAAQGIAARLED